VGARVLALRPRRARGGSAARLRRRAQLHHGPGERAGTDGLPRPGPRRRSRRSRRELLLPGLLRRRRRRGRRPRQQPHLVPVHRELDRLRVGTCRRAPRASTARSSSAGAAPRSRPPPTATTTGASSSP
jgi:hypothetical protein